MAWGGVLDAVRTSAREGLPPVCSRLWGETPPRYPHPRGHRGRPHAWASLTRVSRNQQAPLKPQDQHALLAGGDKDVKGPVVVKGEPQTAVQGVF